MTVKKNPKFNLEKKRGAFFQIGLLLIASLALVAFEWDSFKVNDLALREIPEIPVEEIVDVEVDDEDKEDELFEIPKPTPMQAQQDQVLFDPMDDVVVTEDDIVEDLIPIPVILDIPAPTGEGGGMGTMTPVRTAPFRIVQNMPKFKEGDLMTYIQNHLVYPRDAVELGVDGKVFVEFVVSASGKVKNVKVIKSQDELLNASSVDVIKNLPDFEPGSQNGRKVNVIMTIPINYVLR